MKNNLIDLDFYWTIDLMPEPHRMVIVSGGLAVWTGSVWLSKTGDSSGRVIQRQVKWWMPIIDDTVIKRGKQSRDLLNAHRRFHAKVGCPGPLECYVCAEELIEAELNR